MGSNKKFSPSRINIHETVEKVQSNSGALALTVLIAVILMGFSCLIIFFANVKGHEEVMVPEVRGKQLTDALIEMQNKELYPKITLRYSEILGDEGTILDQNPNAGSIVRGYSRVSLVVSRGAVVDKVENYIGTDYDELRMKFQTLFAGSAKPLIVLAKPEYKADASEAGTILQQDPPDGTVISEPITLRLVVSRGPNFESTRLPDLLGSSVNDVLQTISHSKLIFDISGHTASYSEKEGTVVKQQEFSESFLKNYTRVAIEFALPHRQSSDETTGIFKATVNDYPYPVPMRLDVKTPDETYTLVNFNHIGGEVTLPYTVPKNSLLTLYVVDKAVAKFQAH